MTEFRDLYTIYAIDESAQAIVSPTNQITINVERRLFLLRMLKHHKIEENLMHFL